MAWANAKAAVLIVLAGAAAATGVATGGGEQARQAVPAALAEDILPPSRRADWATAGVPGGIRARMNLMDVTQPPYSADNTGESDAQPAIALAIAQAADNDVVYLPAGTYRVNKPIAIGYKSNITLRGAGPDKTVIMAYNPWGGAVDVGGGADYLWNKPPLMIAASPSKADTVLAVGDTTPLDSYPNGGIGQICQISLKNDPSLPVVVPAAFDYMRRQKSRIVAKTPTTVTISPGLLFNLPAALSPQLAVATRQAEFVGVEDLAIDAAHSASGHGLVYMNQCYGCWVKDVAVTDVPNRHIWIADSLQCEVRQCYVARRRGARGSNGAGILFGSNSFCLVEDNIIEEQFPHIQVEAGSCGNVFAYNFCRDSSVEDLIGVSINANHNPHNSFNLYEGNVSPKFQCDGYHGSSSDDTAFRNWFHGTCDKAEKFGICVYLNRFTRNYSILGNVLGRKGYTYRYDNAAGGLGYDERYIYAFGLPNIGNGGFNGRTVQPSAGSYWDDWEKLLSSPRGKGPGPGGFQELDLDVAATTLLRGNYNYCDNGVRPSESLGGAALPNSLYLGSRPAWFGDLAWPPFGPDTDFEHNKIPAQVRYEEAVRKRAVPQQD